DSLRLVCSLEHDDGATAERVVSSGASSTPRCRKALAMIGHGSVRQRALGAAILPGANAGAFERHHFGIRRAIRAVRSPSTDEHLVWRAVGGALRAGLVASAVFGHSPAVRVGALGKRDSAIELGRNARER